MISKINLLDPNTIRNAIKAIAIPSNIYSNITFVSIIAINSIIIKHFYYDIIKNI